MALNTHMTLAIQIHMSNNQVTASLLGAPEIHVTEATREAAIAALRAKIGEEVSEGDLSFIDVETGGVSALAGKYFDDPSLDEISQEAYKARDFNDA